MAESRTAEADVSYIINAADVKLALHGFCSENQAAAPVLLTHGTFSNYRSCRGLARFLSRHGHDCWVLDNQGHGLSEHPQTDPDFEQMYLQDADAAIAFLRQRYEGQTIAWVGHSGGGLAALMYLSRRPEAQQHFTAIVTLASQATDAAVRPVNRWTIRFAKHITRFLGHAPGHRLGLGPEPEFGAVMQQWYRWSLEGRWIGADNFDYEQALPELELPVMMMAGVADRFIAPESGCRRLFQQLGSAQKRFEVCGKSTGLSEDYTHARIVSSRAASVDIWPQVLNWLRQHDPA